MIDTYTIFSLTISTIDLGCETFQWINTQQINVMEFLNKKKQTSISAKTNVFPKKGLYRHNKHDSIYFDQISLLYFI